MASFFKQSGINPSSSNKAKSKLEELQQSKLSNSSQKLKQSSKTKGIEDDDKKSKDKASSPLGIVSSPASNLASIQDHNEIDLSKTREATEEMRNEVQSRQDDKVSDLFESTVGDNKSTGQARAEEVHARNDARKNEEPAETEEASKQEPQANPATNGPTSNTKDNTSEQRANQGHSGGTEETRQQRLDRNRARVEDKKAKRSKKAKKGNRGQSVSESRRMRNRIRKLMRGRTRGEETTTSESASTSTTDNVGLDSKIDKITQVAQKAQTSKRRQNRRSDIGAITQRLSNNKRSLNSRQYKVRQNKRARMVKQNGRGRGPSLKIGGAGRINRSTLGKTGTAKRAQGLHSRHSLAAQRVKRNGSGGRRSLSLGGAGSSHNRHSIGVSHQAYQSLDTAKKKVATDFEEKLGKATADFESRKEALLSKLDTMMASETQTASMTESTEAVTTEKTELATAESIMDNAEETVRNVDEATKETTSALQALDSVEARMVEEELMKLTTEYESTVTSMTESTEQQIGVIDRMTENLSRIGQKANRSSSSSGLHDPSFEPESAASNVEQMTKMTKEFLEVHNEQKLQSSVQFVVE